MVAQSFDILHTDGSNLVFLNDGEVDTTTTSLALFGKNYAGYGLALNENLVKLLENFAHTIAPSNPIIGQLWWNKSDKSLNTFDGSNWKVISGPVLTPTAPSNPYVGELWWNTVAEQMNVYSGTEWKILGPDYSAAQGKSGQVVSTVTDINDATHTVVEFYNAGTQVAVLSTDPTFTTNVIPGFSTIAPGLTLPTGLFNGSASNSLALGGILAGNYLRGDVDSSTNGNLKVSGALTVGSTNNFSITSSSNYTSFSNNNQGQGLLFSVNVLGTQQQALTVSGLTGLITIAGDPTSNLGVATKQYVDTAITNAETILVKTDGSNKLTGSLLPASSGITLGNVTSNFNTVYSDTTQSNNKELTVAYLADQVYSPGTVLDFGGNAEVTLSSGMYSTKIAGVVSSAAAFKLNAGQVGNTISVAISGRLPISVVGNVAINDLLVSAGNGSAVSVIAPPVGTVIGRALTSFTGNIGFVEVSVDKTLGVPASVSSLGAISASTLGIANGTATLDSNAHLSSNQFPALTGDLSVVAGTTSTVLNTVNNNVGTFGNAYAMPIITVNSKGLVTAVDSAIGPFVNTINGRGGNVTVTSSDITSALGYTPANVMSPNLVGIPTAATATAGTSTNQLATTSFVTQATSQLNSSLGSYLSRSGGVMTGAIVSKTIVETTSDVSISAGSATIDLSAASVFMVNLSQSITNLQFTSVPTVGTALGFTMVVNTMDGGKSITWPTNIRWPYGTIPTVTNTAHKIDIFTFMFYGGGTYLGFASGQNL